MSSPAEEKKPAAAEQPNAQSQTSPATDTILSAEYFQRLLNLPACKSKGYCDNCGRCER